MSDDSFFREVNEEIRHERAKALWDSYGPVAIVIAVLIVIGTGLFVAWEYWVENKANSSGDQFSQALTLANSGKADEALAAFDALEKDGYGAYPLLARMRAATVQADKGDFKAAIAGFDEVAADSSIPNVIRDVARLRAALLLVDNGTYADVSGRVEALTNDTNPLRHSAREALGLAAWKDGKLADALKLFEQISSDEGAPRNARQRSNLLAELIRGSGNAT
ncbi:tetratricopeptide repeat protein [Aminobacter anthyllidis]|uniref:Ancillary SecYEG translocon subunit n=1 Tax=Aminobacter anthyllidis TaxID=1035067 RepID=A0A9X1A903_9HYPH|nr:tetratricopeptide repeat protein [Aminobacter anthyllidis]MBT1155500.1 tetratricopeptide repeat protein [Aminobacter anthyllidis]